MRRMLAFCLTMLIAQPVFAAACDVAVGDYTFAEGDFKSTSVVHGTDAQGVLNKNAAKVLRDMAGIQGTNPVAIRVGTYRNNAVLKDILGEDETAPGMVDSAALIIPGSSTADGLVNQQALKGCL